MGYGEKWQRSLSLGTKFQGALCLELEAVEDKRFQNAPDIQPDSDL